MRAALLVGLGGFLGSMGRWALAGLAQRLAPGSFFPVGTLAVNVVGCLAIGAAYGLADARGVLSPETRAFVVAGVLGGFTTFSAFGYETMALLKDAELARAAVNILLHIILGLAAVWLGDLMARGLHA